MRMHAGGGIQDAGITPGQLASRQTAGQTGAGDHQPGYPGGAGAGDDGVQILAERGMGQVDAAIDQFHRGVHCAACAARS